MAAFSPGGRFCSGPPFMRRSLGSCSQTRASFGFQTNPIRMSESMKALVDEVSAWPGVTSHEHRFGGTEFRLGEREIGHAHWFGIVDIPFTTRLRDALIAAGRAEQHHFVPDSGWTTVRVSKHGEENARNLLRLSYLRIRMKNADEAAAEDARAELSRLGFEDEVLAAAGVSTGAGVGN